MTVIFNAFDFFYVRRSEKESVCADLARLNASFLRLPLSVKIPDHRQSFGFALWLPYHRS